MVRNLASQLEGLPDPLRGHPLASGNTLNLLVFFLGNL